MPKKLNEGKATEYNKYKPLWCFERIVKTMLRALGQALNKRLQ